jgi:hypothetical protein
MAGVYSVYTIANDCTSPTPGTTTVVVNPLPAAPNTGNNGPVCVGNTLSLTASTISGATYSWSGPNGYTSTQQNPTVSVSATTAMGGIYSVIATVNDCVSVAGTTTVEINKITASNNSPVCEGNTLSLAATTISGATYSWTGPNGFTSSQQNPIVSTNATSAMGGVYIVTSTVNGCTSAASVTIITINPAPALPTVTSPVTYCQNAMASPLSATGTNLLWYTMPTGGTGSLTAPTPNTTIAGTTIYYVSQTIGCESQRANISVIVNALPASAGSISGSSTVCQGQNSVIYTVPTIANASSYIWTLPSGTTGASTTNSISVNYGIAAISGDITVKGSNSCGVGIVSASYPITVYIPPLANAGSDVTICQTGTYVLSGIASNYASLLWTTSGDGTFSNAAILNPVYTFGANDITLGTVTLNFTASAISPCTVSSSDNKIIIIQKTPVSNTGTDATICLGSAHQLAGTAQNYSSVLWTTSGNGTFSSTSSLTPVYTPGGTDISAGIVTLYLTASAISPCMVSATDAKILIIHRLPIANAGADASICQTETHTLSGIALNYSNLLWTTSGSGTFSIAAILNPVYSPGATDITIGTVTLTLTAMAISPCITSTSNDLTLIIQKSPTVTAGTDATIIEGESLSISATATNCAGLLWQTTGDGYFDDDEILNPVYHPGNIDIESSTVALFLTGWSNNSCTIPAVDFINLTIMRQQSIQLTNGWNSLSSFVLPLDHSFDQVMTPISNDLVIVKNMSQVYWPEYGINTIGNFDPKKGYVIKMNEPSILPITGFKSQNKTVLFSAGWNILPVISDININYQELFTQLGNEIIIVTEIAGNGIIWPAENVYSIPFLVPGKAYMIKVSGACSFTFPD